MSTEFETEIVDEPQPSTGLLVGLLTLPPLLTSLLVAWFLLLDGMRVAACGPHCDFAGAYSARATVWVTSSTITLIVLAALILRRRRRWRNWPITVLGVVAILVAALLADRWLIAATGG